MDIAAAVRHFLCSYAHDPALGEHGLYLLHGKPVVFVAVLRKDDAAVDYQKVHIRGYRDLPILTRKRALNIIYGIRAGQIAGLFGQAELVYLELSALCVRRIAKRFIGRPGLFIERMLRVVRVNAGDLAGSYKAGDVVDMAVGLVRVDAFLYPYYLFQIQMLYQHLLDFRPVHMRIASLAEQAHLRCQQRALAVDAYRAALEDEALSAVAVDVLDLAYLLSNEVVVCPGEVKAIIHTAPRVEGPVICAELALVIDNKRRAAVARPCVVAHHLHDPDVLGQTRSCVLILRRIHAYRHRLKLAYRSRDIFESLLRRLGAVAPVIGPFRPEHPYLLLLFKFRRHSEAVLLWC